jgi:cell division protein FtsW (lipid II flippase)
MSNQGITIVSDFIIPILVASFGLITLIILLFTYKNKKNE